MPSGPSESVIPRKVNALDAIFCQPLTPSVLKLGNKSAHSDLELEISLESVELKSMFLGQKREMHTNHLMALCFGPLFSSILYRDSSAGQWKADLLVETPFGVGCVKDDCPRPRDGFSLRSVSFSHATVRLPTNSALQTVENICSFLRVQVSRWLTARGLNAVYAT